MKTVLMQTPNSTDGVSLFRHYGPMIELEKEGHCRLLPMPDDLKSITHWHYFKKSHVAMISRSAQLFDQVFAEQCLKYSIPIWFEMDDNLFLVPDTSEAYQYYQTPKAQSTIKFLIENAKVITVATHPLKQFLLKNFNRKATVIPNALDDYLLKFKKNFNNNKKVSWRGSGGGTEAVLYYGNSIINLIKEYPKHEWGFFGLNPYFLNRSFNPPPIKWHKGEDFIDYIIGLCQFNASYCFMTHLDTEFDRTKSHNGWKEATLAGSVCLVPDIGEWSEIPNTCVFKYKVMDSQDFFKQMNIMLTTDPFTVKQMHKNSLDLLTNEYLMSIINKRRLNILETING